VGSKKRSSEHKHEGTQQAHGDSDEKLGKKERARRAMEDWPPTAKDLRAWMDVQGLSNKDVAKALRLSDGRVVRFWTSKKNPRQIPYPSWYTLRHKFSRAEGG